MVMDFRNGELVCNPLAGFARPVGDSDDLYAILLCEARNMEGLGVAAGSDQADADAFFRHEMAHSSASVAYQWTVDRRYEARRLSRLLQRALQQLQPVLTPEDLTRGQHEARRAEDTRCQCLLRKLVV